MSEEMNLEEMREELKRLRAENEELEALRDENEDLRGWLEFFVACPSPNLLVSAEVSHLDASDIIAGVEVTIDSEDESARFEIDCCGVEKLVNLRNSEVIKCIDGFKNENESQFINDLDMAVKMSPYVYVDISSWIEGIKEIDSKNALISLASSINRLKEGDRHDWVDKAFRILDISKSKTFAEYLSLNLTEENINSLDSFSRKKFFNAEKNILSDTFKRERALKLIELNKIDGEERVEYQVELITSAISKFKESETFSDQKRERFEEIKEFAFNVFESTEDKDYFLTKIEEKNVHSELLNGIKEIYLNKSWESSNVRKGTSFARF